jgi:transposase
VDREVLKQLVDAGASVDAIAQRLGVGHSTVRLWLKRHGLQTRHMRVLAEARQARQRGDRTALMNCPHHGHTEFLVDEQRARCLRCRSAAVTKRRRKIKYLLVAEAGGCCALCGYGTHPGVLQFHHVDPGDKRFSLSHTGVTRSIEKARAEARKCVLLCANCHAEVELGVVALPIESTLSELEAGGTRVT